MSEYVRDFLHQEWGISTEKIGRVYHGVDSLVDPVRPRVLAEVDRPFLFTAGSIRPARGLEDFLQALSNMSDLPAEYAVVIAGQTDPGMDEYRNRLERLVQASDVRDRVFWTGRLSPAEMTWCYKHCRWFVMTSRAEACPNTALEALASGCAILSTDQSPMPEFFQASALYYPARNPAVLAQQLHKALHLSEDERAALQSAARERGAEFQWARTARQTLEELQRALQPDSSR